MSAQALGRRGPKVLGDDSTQYAMKLPRVVLNALLEGAKTNYESPANYGRRAIIAQLRADGLLPPAFKP